MENRHILDIAPQGNEGIELQNALVELEKKKEYLEGIKQDRKQRKWFAVGIFIFVGLFIIAVLLIITLNNKMSDTVLVALLTTTTADVLGVFMIVAKYLFPSRDNAK